MAQTEKQKEYQKKYKQSEKYKSWEKEYKQSEKYKSQKKAYRQSVEYKEIRRKYKESEKGKEAFKKASRKYQQSEKGKKVFRHNSGLRKARKLNQCPDWADLKAIKEFYKNCPEGYHVDHVYPLSKGGLHCVENLQYLTAKENKEKGNKIIIQTLEHNIFSIEKLKYIKIKQIILKMMGITLIKSNGGKKYGK